METENITPGSPEALYAIAQAVRQWIHCLERTHEYGLRHESIADAMTDPKTTKEARKIAGDSNAFLAAFLISTRALIKFIRPPKNKHRTDLAASDFGFVFASPPKMPPTERISREIAHLTVYGPRRDSHQTHYLLEYVEPLQTHFIRFLKHVRGDKSLIDFDDHRDRIDGLEAVLRTVVNDVRSGQSKL